MPTDCSSEDSCSAFPPPGDERSMALVRLPSPIEGFTVDNVLTRDECRQLVDLSVESGLKWSGESGGPHFAGRRQRTTFHAADLAQVLFDRLAPLLHEHASPVHHDRFGERHDLLGPSIASGEYVVVGINDLFRASKYDAPNGKFSWHTDTAYVRDDQFAGFWTLLIYLNDDFEGGETSFYTDDGGERLCTVHPRTGKVLAFHHYQVHDGRRVTAGTKWLIRTELMYRRVLPIPRSAPASPA